MSKRAGSLLQYFRSCKVATIPTFEEEELEENGKQEALLPLGQDHVEEDEIDKGENPIRPSEPNPAVIQSYYTCCWSRKQADYFLSTYPLIMLHYDKIGCRVCKNIHSINMFRDHGIHLRREWINCEISSDAEKSAAQKQLRKKIVKHANSKAYLTANKLFLEREIQSIENATISSINYQRQNTEKCIRTA
eukprot:gene11890-2443_t